MKHVLVTAGTVYGKLDDNKLVGNRIRGIWATKFACWLYARGYRVTLLMPDTMSQKDVSTELETAISKTDPDFARSLHVSHFTVLQHTGYQSYAEQCYALAPEMDAAVMAAAVVNWIPTKPIPGKMRTDGFREGDTQLIEFMLAPRVIDRMKKLNPKIALIGCKMTSGASPEETLDAAYTTLIKSHANVVVANDLKDLKQKKLIYPDGATFPMITFEGLYAELAAVIEDEHYHTEKTDESVSISWEEVQAAERRAEAILTKHFDGFVKRRDGVDRVFGGLAVRVNETQFLVSPREKGLLWYAKDMLLVTALKDRITYTVRGYKASLNAPVLIRHLQKYHREGSAVLHQHRVLADCQTAPYAPPGTVRDNERNILDRTYNIEGHGFIALLNEDNLFLF